MREWGAAGKAEAARRQPCGLCGDAILHGYVCVFLHQVNSRWMIHSRAFCRHYTKKLLRLKDTFYQFFYQFFWVATSRSKLDFSDSLPLVKIGCCRGRDDSSIFPHRGGDPSLLSETARLGRFTNSEQLGSRAGPCGCFAVRALRSPDPTPSARAHSRSAASRCLNGDSVR